MSSKANDRALSLALFLFLLSAYLLTYSGTFHSSDGQAMFAVGESLVRRGDYDINQIRWMALQQGDFGPNGDLYCHKGPATSLFAVPLIWLGLVVPFWGVVQSGMLFNVIVTALTGALLYWYARRLGYSASTALICGVVFGLATMAWPYSKYFFSEPLSGLTLLAAAYFLLGLRSGHGHKVVWRSALLSGLCLGAAIATRFANALLAPILIGALLAYLLLGQRITEMNSWHDQIRCGLAATWKELALFLLPLLLWALVLVAYNYLRFGDPFTTGYLGLEESFSAPTLVGIPGLLISPGRSVFLYGPVLLALIPAVPAFFRRHRLEALLLLLIGLCYLLVYGRWFMWHGGFAWGPRFLVPIIPLLVVMLAPFIETMRGKGRAAFWTLFGLGLVVQIEGLSVDFIHHQQALIDTGLPLFDPATFFDPRYAQLWGTLAFIRPENLDFAWVRTSPTVAIDWLALCLCLFLLGLSAGGLILAARQTPLSRARKLYVFILLPLLLVSGTGISLARCKVDGHEQYAQMLQFLQAGSQSGDVILQNSPEETAIFQNLYKGHLPCYGLFEGAQPLSQDTSDLLERLAQEHNRFWLIPDGLPAEENSLDRWFLERGYSPSHQQFGGERLTLYSGPAAATALAADRQAATPLSR
jgi:hypothetical protein